MFGHAGSTTPESALSPEQWIKNVFAAKAVAEGGVIRRKARDIERYAGWERFRRELDRRGFRAVVNGGQVVVFCNREPLRVIEPEPWSAAQISRGEIL